MSNELQKLESYSYQLAVAETFEDIKSIQNQADILAEFARRNNVHTEKQNELGRFRLLIEAKKGKWLDDHFPHGTIENLKKGNNIPEGTKIEPSGKMPATKKESSQAKEIMRAEEEEIQEVCKEIENEGKVITPKEVSNRIKKKKKKEDLEKKKEEYQEKVKEAKNINDSFKIDIYNTDKKFRIIYADPPWQYADKQENSNLGGASKHYNTMSINEICDLPINDITDKNSVLFLWVTSPQLNHFLSLMTAWGFEYKTSFVWDKIKHNMGHYNSVRHEFLLIGGKGSSVPDVKKLYDSVISIKRSDKHSEKPIEFMNIIDELYTHGERLELFCRQPMKDNWFFWGNEV